MTNADSAARTPLLRRADAPRHNRRVKARRNWHRPIAERRARPGRTRQPGYRGAAPNRRTSTPITCGDPRGGSDGMMIRSAFWDHVRPCFCSSARMWDAVLSDGLARRRLRSAFPRARVDAPRGSAFQGALLSASVAIAAGPVACGCCRDCALASPLRIASPTRPDARAARRASAAAFALMAPSVISLIAPLRIMAKRARSGVRAGGATPRVTRRPRAPARDVAWAVRHGPRCRRRSRARLSAR